ncbi:MAG TPA: glutamate 5-kinase [Candidatus Limnocylindria bacterium]|nr:glutamate 5-kinase [Candidatus Limnocylindria bacterium]
MHSELMRKVDRVVVKLGTGVLTDARKRPDQVQFAQLVSQVAALRALGKQVVLVTSGAVGAGMGVLGYDRRPPTLAELQACAAVGQSRLMAMYEALFRHYELNVAQVLLTHEDLADHTRHLNARNTLVTLLKRGVVPIINENDAVSVTELKFGDNDRLSALVAALLPADLLVILTTADGLMQNYGKPDARLLPVVEHIDETIEGMAGGTSSATAVGGMVTKISAARICVRSGTPLVIASGRKFDLLPRLLAGEPQGTLFLPNSKKLPSRKRWIAFYHQLRGTLVLDDGAVQAVKEQGRSLLAPGIVRCEGDFPEGVVVRLADSKGREIARGLVRFSSSHLQAGETGRVEVVHRDDLVVL